MRAVRDLVGETLSERYCLVSRVAGGGMGEVYRGLDLLLDRSVAVKVLQPSLATDPQLVARFKQEARAAARLSHPNAVAVHDWGSADERTYYMVMEYVDGTDLRDLLVGHGALEPAQAVEIMAAVCDALFAAHSHGLVHRDVKPENILIARDGTVKVGDFGIAVVADADATSPGGAAAGTLRYLSPEQAAGREASAASDIWAAGAVLAEALTGRPPLQGSGAELLQRRASEPPVVPSELDPRIPKELDDVVLKACAVDPEARYVDAAEMGQDLRRAAVRALPDAPPVASLLADLTTEIRAPDMIRNTQTRTSRRGARRSRRRAVAVGALVALLAVLGVVIALLTGLFGPRDVKVPSLVGLAAERAEERAERLGLIVEVTGRRAHLRVPEGHVIRQEPPSGMLEEGSTIGVVVSTGLPLRGVPSVVGLGFERAKNDLERRDLRVGEVTGRYGDEPAGVVVAQEPEGGRIEWGSKVHLVLSKGPRPVAVPNVVGMTEENATAALERAGFEAAVARVYDDEVAAGRVVSTSPAAGTRVAEGSGVAVAVSQGGKLSRFGMPDVRGMTVAAARARLERLGLVVQVQRACPGASKVVETDPVPGQRVVEGQRAALFVC